MRISREQGFTLIEVLIVILIISILIGVVVVAPRTHNARDLLKAEAHELIQLTKAANNYAVLSGTAIGLSVTVLEGINQIVYQWWRWDIEEEKWVSLKTMKQWSPHVLPAKMSLSITSEVLKELDQDDTHADEDEDDKVPEMRIIFFNTGVMTPASIVFTLKHDQSVSVFHLETDGVTPLHEITKKD
ncbi:MAG: prepilin-type N-terminal cleavage/methylation domain-containing protein [Endozoicomonadaceae bacterium]|nr:prepilin-type N-terminal cleavage/methylation domain-containing protein [Endozoicomonadaceae bacterium]